MGRVSSAIPKGLLTTIGDIIAASAVGVPARIAAPASGQVLTGQGVGVLPAWAAAAAQNPGEGHILIAPFNYQSISVAHTLTLNAIYYLNNSFYNNGADGTNVTYNVYLAAGTYSMRIITLTADNQCIMQVNLDGVQISNVDHYSVGTVQNVIEDTTGIVVATSGLKTLQVKANGKNAASSSYYYDLRSICLWRTA